MPYLRKLYALRHIYCDVKHKFSKRKTYASFDFRKTYASFKSRKAYALMSGTDEFVLKNIKELVALHSNHLVHQLHVYKERA
ncbi:hypothetical protein SAMN05421687_103239 [Salimicrobium flavidum]|uniref:Uncharacterized protein n=1 Tax=Salimicrobium flavidum TaxID=570947 RepID=A0A1N7J2A5_9BACI|nr:hypothetical protein SAMN05421687_103239 [Salimicrobium flavidum]